MADRSEFTARYLIESATPLEKAAEIVAGEQSSGTFLAVPGETKALRERSRARVISVERLDDRVTPTLASAYETRRGTTAPYHQGIVEIGFPIANVGVNLVNLLATVAGNLFELGEITGARLLDIDLPEEYASRFEGPRFGIPGTRKMAGVDGRPLLGTIIKPSIGLTPAETAELVDTLLAADLDFIKDDELNGDPSYASFDARLAAVMPVVARHADRLGRKPMYAINISGSLDEMRRRHDQVLAAGGTCIMVSVNWIGFAALQDLRGHTALPIHGHRNGWGLLTRCPALGFDFRAYQKLWRLAGVDQLHVNGLRSKFWEPDESVIVSARACLKREPGLAPAMPVFSSGQWAGQAADTFAGLGSTDLLYLAGGGIIGHPDGPAAGVASLKEAWEAAAQGIGVTDYAKDRPALRRALEFVGHRDGS
jgi:ribulose-bisphosphate carboxylase large chain